MRWVCLVSLFACSVAWAQTETPDDEQERIPDPNVPDVNLPREQAARAPAYRYEKRDYPVEVVKRPLTLAADQAEVTLDLPFVAGDGHPTLTQVLRGAYGVTVDFQAGVTYSVGLERLNAQGDEKAFQAGKAVSLDGAYTIVPAYLAAELRLGLYVDPDLFGIALIGGVPFKFTLGDDWAIYGGADLIRVKLKDLAADPADPAANLAGVDLINRGGKAPSGALNATAAVAYQARRNLAVWGSAGFGWPDFDADRQTFALFAGATLSPRHFWDLGARIGMSSVADAAETFSVGVFTALRL